MAKTTRKFKAEVSQVLSLVINSLYSNKEIFLRELVSNASDALDKLQFKALTEPELLGDDPGLKIRLEADEEAGTLTIWDNGIGMSEEELIELLGTIAHSGSRTFLEELKSRGETADVNIIGQFGVGFYSAYLVADKVEVISKKAGEDAAYKWSSDAQEKFTVEPAERDVRGTSVVLHLREDQKDFASPWRLRQLVKQYSDFVGHPIEMLEMKYGEDEEEPKWEQINKASALWQRTPSDVTDEQYEEFYKHLSGDWEPPVARTHFKVEGTQQFAGLLFIPSRPPFDLFYADAEHGVRLFVKRVFIMDKAEALMPRWLRFVKGVVDSDDLPLNVSRELLQDSRIVQTIRKQLTKRTLDLLQEVADERPDDYKSIWENFGKVIKEGLHYDPTYKDKLSKLLRFESSSQAEPTSLDAYIERMPEGQEHIYYALGASRSLLDGSPHLEVLRKKGYEVLYLTDGIDQWAIETLPEYEGKKLVDASKDELDVNETEEEREETKAKEEELKPLTERFQDVLQNEISEVRFSKRLADSPACLVVPEGGLASHIERMLRAQNQDVPDQKRILELNPNHPLIEALNKMSSSDAGKVNEWVEMIYDHALLAEGSPIKSPARFAQRLTGLMQEAALRSVE
jgi:molecular chaperone HtpG